MDYGNRNWNGNRGLQQRPAALRAGYSAQGRDRVRPAVVDTEVGLKQMLKNDVKLGAALKPELYSQIAEKIAIGLGSKKDINASTQIRRFYDELVYWSDRVRLAEFSKKMEEFNACAPYINMLVARAAYARGRGLVTEGFEQMIRCIVTQIKDAETLKQGRLFLEAVIGFRKALGK